MYKMLLSALFLGSFALAQSSHDYAYGFELDVEDGSAFSRVSLPDEVYLHSLSPSLDDVAIFNKNDRLAAFSFIDMEETEYIIQEIPVILYFVSDKMSNTTDGSAVYTYTYMIKPSNMTNYPTLFKLEWESSTYNWEAKAKVKVQSTDGYYQSTSSALLAELRDVSDGNILKLDEIALDDSNYYDEDEIESWHLTITSEVKIPKIKSIKAYAEEQFINRSLVALDAKYEDSANSTDTAVYKLPSVQPVESIYIDLVQYDLILPLTIFYRSDNKSDWIKLDGRIVNEEADIKFSKIILAKEFMLKTNGSFSDIPQVTARRKKVDIVFNSANSASFILAYGSFGAKALDLPSSEFLKDTDLDYIPDAIIGNPVKLGGEKAFEVKAEEKSGIPKWAIWIALVFGVGFLIFLAYKLSKEMKAG
ncbi:MAG: DUF3999 domain-containing protein [Campylobacteraceae bacterium]|jgi:hypothetical protein|nr:DUF3999 domain-containing protein [Campylobacteraceae bacterium]